MFKETRNIVLRPKVDKEFDKLIPEILPIQYWCEITGPTEFVNAIRRTITHEMLVKGMIVSKYECNNPFLVDDYIAKRINLIPINQNVELNSKFKIRVENTGNKILPILSGDIKGSNNNINKNILLCELNPGESLNADIEILENFGFMNAAHCVALAAVPSVKDFSIPAAINENNLIELKFETHGTMEPREILIKACENLIYRLNNILEIVDTIKIVDNLCLLNIIGEDHTIGKLLTRGIYQKYPEINNVSYEDNSINRSCTIKITTSEEPITVFTVSINHCKKWLSDLKKEI